MNDLIDRNEAIVRRYQSSVTILNKYETPMLIFFVMTCRLHICDMFNKMSIMASRGLVKPLIKCFY